MTLMRHSICSGLAAMALVGALHVDPPKADAPHVDRAALIREVIEAAREKHGQPAIAAAVVDRGEITSAVVGVRVINQEAHVEPADRFHIASCTKAMTATVIALLVQDGIIEWETRALDVFPEFAETAHEAYRGITVRDLLTHRAGVVPGTAGNAPESLRANTLTGSSREQRVEAVRFLLETEPVAARHAQVIYSNAGFGIAAAMAERLADHSWEQLLKERLFAPLEMTNAGFGWPATPERVQQPLGHRVIGDRLVPLPINSPYKIPHAFAPAGNVNCSIDDLARFARLHLDALRGRETPLTEQSVKVLHDPAFGCGWFPQKFAGHDARWHNGTIGTFLAWMTIWPEHDLAVVVMTNAGNGEPACREITEKLCRRLRAGHGKPGE